MRISHWSSDVCSSDLLYLPIGAESSLKGVVDLVNNRGIVWQDESLGAKFDYVEIPADMADKDRKSVVEGKSVSVRVDLGGRRILKKKKQQQHKHQNYMNNHHKSLNKTFTSKNQ